MLERFLLAAVLAALPLAAGACSCAMPDPVDGSFPHQFVRRLPANAKGALFLAPPPGPVSIADFPFENASIIKAPRIELSPSAFDIKDGAGKKYRARVTPLELRGDGDIPASKWGSYYAFASKKAEKDFAAAREKPALAELLSGGQVKDISYTMSDERRLFLIAPEGGFKPGQTYTISYRSPFPGRGRAVVVHEIAPDAVDTKGAYKLVLDGAPVRRMVTFAQGGSCSGDYLSLRQEFHFEPPESLKPYREALTYLPEVESRKVPGRFHDTVIHGSLCSVPEPELARNTGGRGGAVVGCETTRPVQVRGWVGFPEVDGRLQLVGPVLAPFGSAKGRACTAVALLNESLMAGDMDSAAYAACNIANDASMNEVGNSRGAAPKMPSLATIARLMQVHPLPNSCATDLMAGYAWQKNYQALQAVHMFGVIGSRELADPATRMQGVLDYKRMLDATVDNPQATQLLQMQLEAKLPQISALLAGAPQPGQTGDILDIIARMGDRGRLAAPALKRLIRPDEIYARIAIRTMEKVAPGDPELPGLLQRFLQAEPGDEAALLAYSRVADTRNSREMLMKLVPHLGSYAGDVTQVVANYKPHLLKAAAREIGPERMKPVLEVLARKPLSPARRGELRELVVAMSASKAQEKALLDWLAAQP